MKKFTFLVLAFATTLFSCKEDSALEDVELSDVSLLQQEIKINETGHFIHPNTISESYNQSFEIIIEDKNDQPLEIKGANISVNGISTVFGKPITLSNNRYFIEDFSAISKETSFTTTIQFDNGNVFNTEVAPPNLLNMKTRLNPENYTITWEGSPIDRRASNTTLQIAYTTKSGNIRLFGNAFIKIEDVGIYDFRQILENAPDFINDNFTEIRFTISKLNSGKLSNDGFRERPKFFFGLSNVITITNYKSFL